MRIFRMVAGPVLPAIAAAQEFGPGAARQVGLPAKPLEQMIVDVVNTALILVAVVALAFLVYGGFRYITSRGDEREVEAAKNTVTYAVIGLVVIGVAAALVNFVVGAVLTGGRGGGAPVGGGPGGLPGP